MRLAAENKMASASSGLERAGVLKIIPVCDAPVSEWDWVASLIEPLPFILKPFRKDPPVEPGSLFIHTNRNGFEMTSAFLDAISRTPDCGLLHLGDEYLRCDLKVYAAFSYVIRMFPVPTAEMAGVCSIPLGFTNGLEPAAPKPASQRAHHWMFAGDEKSDRQKMIRAFEDVPSGLVSMPKSWKGQKGISRDAYLAALADARFCLAPAGNLAVETCRTYEALEFGAIPVVPRRKALDPYSIVLGDHPLPAFDKWSEAAAFVAKTASDDHAVDALQTRCAEWWSDKKSQVSAELCAYIEDGRKGKHKPLIEARFRAHGLSLFERAGAIMSQQNSDQIVSRLGKYGLNSIRILTGRSQIRGIWSYFSPGGTANAPHFPVRMDEESGRAEKSLPPQS